jgi:hypothetical protein
MPYSESHTYRLPVLSTGLSDVQQAEFNGKLARWAFMEVRVRFRMLGVKSGNKVRRGDANSSWRWQHAAARVLQVQNAIWQNRQSPLLDFTPAMEHGAGNCGEMSGAVAQIVNRSGGYAEQYCVDLVGSHAFALVGLPPQGATDPVTLAGFDPCWAVDPWAGIVCPAIDYCVEFERKMHHWAALGKSIYYQQQWVQAADPRWITAVTRGHKRVNIAYTGFVY